MNITDKGLDIAKDLISEKSEEKISLENVEAPDIEDIALPQEDVTTNSISLDEVDTSAIDNISLPEENIETEQISLDNVEIPEPTAGEDFINQIDNKFLLMMLKPMLQKIQQNHLTLTKKNFPKRS